MKNALKKSLPLFLVLVLTSAVCLLFSVRKSGMFIDEIYTYGLSNGFYTPYLSDIKGGSMVGETFTRAELFDYVSVTDGEGFDFSSVYYNQARDVHPPLYYWLFHIVSMFFRGSFTKWTGLALDYVLYLAALVVLYKLSMQLFSSRPLAAAVTVLYALSLLGLSTMLMIRMYVLLTLFTVWLALLVARQMAAPSLKTCVKVGLCIFLGLLTQYYFVFYAFFLCVSYLIYALVRKEYGALWRFALCAVAGVLLLLLVFPACLNQLFADKLVSGGSALSNLKDFSLYPSRLAFFLAEARHGLKAAIYVSLAALLLLLVLFRKLRLQYRLGALRFESLVILLPAYLTFALVAILSPVAEQRYIYNIVPILVLTAGFLLYLLDKALWVYGTDRIRFVSLAVIAALALWEARCAPPQYLYPEYREYDAVVSEYASCPCVYYTDNRFEAMTQDLLQLLAFEDVHVLDEARCTALAPYVNDSPAFVAFFDISEYWGSGYDPDTLLAEIAAGTEYDSAALLYQNGLSATYLISK